MHVPVHDLKANNIGVNARDTMNGGFEFDLAAKRTRLSDEDIVVALQAAAEAFNGSYFTSPQYDGLPGNRPHSATVIDSFGSRGRVERK
jgi:hypothetical protein